MLFLLPAPFLFFEFFVFVLFAMHFGFLTTMAFYWVPSFIGVLLIPFMPGVGLLLIPPTLTTRVLALFFFIPGVRRFSQRYTTRPSSEVVRENKASGDVIDIEAEILSDSEPSAIRRDSPSNDRLK